MIYVYVYFTSSPWCSQDVLCNLVSITTTRTALLWMFVEINTQKKYKSTRCVRLRNATLQLAYWNVPKKKGHLQFLKALTLYTLRTLFTLRKFNIPVQNSVEVKASFWSNITQVFFRSYLKATMCFFLQVTGYSGQRRNTQIVWLFSWL